MKNLYVISGITGMTGNELARQIINRNHDIVGFDNFFASSIDTIGDVIESPALTFFKYDLNNAVQMNELEAYVQSSKGQYDKIIYINCAAVVHTEHFYKVDSTFATNVLGMKAFLDQAICVGADQYINCSTSEIYSMQSFNEEGGVSESDYVMFATAEHSQRTSYATGKLLTEFFMKDAVDKGLIKGCSIRFANVYSKNEKLSKHIIPHLITSLFKTGELELLENAKVTQRTFLHNIDSCSAVLALSDTDNALDGTVYNVATDEEISIIDLAKLIADKLGMKLPEIKFKGVRTADPQRRLLSTDKLIGRTAWKPVISLSEGLDMCIDFIKNSK